MHVTTIRDRKTGEGICRTRCSGALVMEHGTIRYIQADGFVGSTIPAVTYPTDALIHVNPDTDSKEWGEEERCVECGGFLGDYGCTTVGCLEGKEAVR